MAFHDIYVPFDATTTDPALGKLLGDVTGVSLSVDYLRGSGVVVSAYPAMLKDGRERPAILLTSGVQLRMANATRDSKTLVATYLSLARTQVQDQIGTAWDAVLKLCREMGYPVPSEATVAEAV